MHWNVPKNLEGRLPSIKVLVVDDDPYMRKVVRTMLSAIGITRVKEAADGNEGLEAVVKFHPDIVIVDWDMPVIDGLQFTKMVRSPNEFAVPNVPIILLSGHSDYWRVKEAARCGVHEYLLKPVSTKALLDRIVAVLVNPREMVQIDGCYVPAPRKLVVLDAGDDQQDDDVLLLR